MIKVLGCWSLQVSTLRNLRLSLGGDAEFALRGCWSKNWCRRIIQVATFIYLFLFEKIIILFIYKYFLKISFIFNLFYFINNHEV